MTVIAWDGKYLAADKRMTCAGVQATCSKIRMIKRNGRDEIIAWTGDQDSGEAVAAWYESGAGIDEWPECQKNSDTWARLIVVDCDGLRFYERQPYPTLVEDEFAAYGSGRDFALAAMYLGKRAFDAVAIAAHFDTGSGNGIDCYHLPYTEQDGK